jgi:transposase
MLQHELIRRMVLIDGLSQREVARKLGHARKSVAKALILPAPEPYKLAASKPRPKLDEFVDIVRQWLTEDKLRHRKQRHSAVRIHERLVDEHGFTGGRRSVSDLVKQLRARDGIARGLRSHRAPSGR